MQKRIFLALAMACAVAGAWSASADGSNFAGTWSLDKTKSEGLQGQMANADVTMVVTQDTKQLTTETKVVGQGGQAMPSQPFTYKLDGSETSAEITGRMAGKATLKAKWMGDGKVLELNQERKVNFNGNDVTISIKEHWELADGGKTLKVHRTTDSPRGTQESSLVFNKK